MTRVWPTFRLLQSEEWPNICTILSCRRTRAFTSLLDSLHPKLCLGHEWLIEPPPTFPFLKSQCQTARRPTIFTSKYNGNTTFARKPRSSVGAGYRCGVRPCQTQKSPKKRFFSGACGRPRPTERNPRPPPYIGAGQGSATSGGRRNAAQQFRPVNKGFRQRALR